MSLKKFLMAAVAIVLLSTPIMWSTTLHSEAAPHQQDATERTITVTGYGTSYGAPDIVRLGLGVESVNPDIMVAMDDVSSRINAVMQTLQDAGVALEDIRTEYFSIYQDYSYSGPQQMEGGQSTPAYRVSTSLAVTVRSTENVGELIASAVSAGANLVNYMQFDIADRATLESQARTDAVADARVRAEELAAQLGVTVGDAIRVVEGDQNAVPMYDRGGGGGMGAGSSVPISEGQLSVSMAVTITFAVQ
ncbi:MAG TPA: SIMPL domain-containing protein [Aggregatilineaceae bacterium]|nr:SIMPL domain-containing protein [Aggregatilineaceae bacterium]